MTLPCLGSGRGGDVRSRANGTEAIPRWTSAAATAVVGASTSPSTGLTLSVMTALTGSRRAGPTERSCVKYAIVLHRSKVILQLRILI